MIKHQFGVILTGYSYLTASTPIQAVESQVYRIISKPMKLSILSPKPSVFTPFECPIIEEVDQVRQDQYEEHRVLSSDWNSIIKLLMYKLPAFRSVTRQDLIEKLKEVFKVKETKIKPKIAKITPKDHDTTLLGCFRVLDHLIDQEVTIVAIDETSFFSQNFSGRIATGTSYKTKMSKRA